MMRKFKMPLYRPHSKSLGLAEVKLAPRSRVNSLPLVKSLLKVVLKRQKTLRITIGYRRRPCAQFCKSKTISADR